MKLPSAADAIIDKAKLQDYLLSTAHPVGRFKAAFFQTLGYSREEWAQLEADLREHHLSQDITETVESAYGVKYVIRATLKGPSGKSADVVSVWIVLKNQEMPRFVTAYPGEG